MIDAKIMFYSCDLFRIVNDLIWNTNQNSIILLLQIDTFKLFCNSMGGKESLPLNPKVPLQCQHPYFTSAVQSTSFDRISVSHAMDRANWDKWISEKKDVDLKEEFILMGKDLEYEKAGMCGGGGLGKIEFHNYPYLLSGQIDKRAEKKEYFEENDLWFLTYCLVSAQHQFLTKTGHKLGDIRPANTFVSEEGEIKVPCLLSWPNFQTNYIKTMLGKEITYLAPEQLDSMGQGDQENIDSVHSQVFSSGLTILSCAQLTDCSSIYRIKDSCIDTAAFDKVLEDWKKNDRYSDLFKGVILNMCEKDRKNRITLGELWAWIISFQKQIEKKDKFVVKNVPSKIQKSIDQIRGKKVKSLYSPLQPAIDSQATIKPQIKLSSAPMPPTVIMPTVSTPQIYFKAQTPLPYQPKLQSQPLSVQQPIKRANGSINIRFVSPSVSNGMPLQFIGNTPFQPTQIPSKIMNASNSPLISINEHNSENRESTILTANSPRQTNSEKPHERKNSTPEVVVLPSLAIAESATRTPESQRVETAGFISSQAQV